MLKTFRENFKHLQWILWAVIAIFVVFVFVDWGMGSTRSAGGPSDVAAQGGNVRITTGEFQSEYRETEDRYRQMYGKNFTPELLKAMNLPERVLQNLIDRQLLKEEANKLHLSVTDEEASQKVLGMKDGQGRLLFVKDGVFVGDATYRRMLANAHLTPAQFEGDLRSQLLLEKLNRFYTDSSFVSDEEVENDFASKNVKAKIAYVLIPASPIPPSAVTDAEAEAAFKENPSAYLQPEKRKAKYLLVDAAKVRNGINVSDADVKAEYDANLDTYKKSEEVRARHILYKSDGTPAGDAAAKAKAEAAIKKLKAGGDFAALAKAESDDPGSKPSGGDLGTFGKGQMVPEFEQAAFSAKPNEIVGPVKTTYGYHVIQVQEKLEPRVQPLAEVSAAIRQRLVDQRAAAESKRIAQQLADDVAKIGKPSDDDMRKKTGAVVTFNETEFFGKGDPAAGVGYNPAFNNAVFGLRLNETTGPVQTGRGEAVVKLVEIKKPGVPTFAEVKARVVADLVKKKQEQATTKALADAMAGGASLDDVAKKLNGKVETPDAFGKTGPIGSLGAAQPLLDATFAATTNVGDVKGPIGVGDRGAVAFKLLEKTPFDRAKFDAEKAQIKESLKSQKSGRLLESLIAKRRTEARIDINRELLARFGGKA